jgi:hypothetical protein
MREIEAWGVTYERYALQKEILNLCRQLEMKTVAEMPAHGAKAMPSVYALGFGLAGKHVTLINGDETYGRCWDRLGLGNRVRFLKVRDLYTTGIPSGSFDFVWNFAFLPLAGSKYQLLEEMKRISKRYVAIFSVNYGNIGFHVHRTVHKLKKVPWTHGDVHYNKRKNVAQLLRRHGLKIVRKGFVDCPVWPDSIGFRDMRLHRQQTDPGGVDWESPYVTHLVSGRFPLWVRSVYAWENAPSPSFIKTLYAHLNYVVAEKRMGT